MDADYATPNDIIGEGACFDRSYVEKRWTTADGYEACVVILMHYGEKRGHPKYRVGYVAVPPGHPLHGMTISALWDEAVRAETDEDKLLGNDGGCSVAFGAMNPRLGMPDGWWNFGWDANHSWHHDLTPDPETWRIDHGHYTHSVSARDAELSCNGLSADLRKIAERLAAKAGGA